MTRSTAKNQGVGESLVFDHRCRFARSSGIPVLVSAMLLMVVFGGCDWENRRQDSPGSDLTVGSLSITITGDIRGLSIQPPLDMTVASYQITVSGPGSTVSRSLDASQNMITIDSLVAGDWTVTVHGLNGDDPAVVIATGTGAAPVLPGQTATADVTVRPVSGQGTLQLALSWPDSAVPLPSIGATLTDTSGVGVDISSLFTIDSSSNPNTASYLGTWDAGYYTLRLSLSDDSVQVWGDMIAVRIIADQVSLGAYALVESDMNLVEQNGSLEVHVGADLQNPDSITFEGNVPEIGPSQSMTIHAVLDPADVPDSVEWYLNGAIIAGATDTSIAIGPSGVSVASGVRYRLTIVVRRGDIVSTGGVSFSVLWPVEQGLIAFMTRHEDLTGYWLYTMYADGTHRQLVSDAVGGYDPDWSPDGSRIASSGYYSGPHALSIVNSDGSDPLILTDNEYEDRYPSWSPDGNWIAFSSTRNGNADIYLIRPDGTGEIRLTDDAGSDTEPDWSPDGTRIVFVSDRDGDREIFVMNADGSGVEQITSNTTSDMEPAWSPDGMRIAFARMGLGIRLVDPDGGDEVTVYSGSGYSPAWSPDGTRLVFMAQVAPYSGDAVYEIMVIDSDGSDLQRLTDNDIADYFPSWTAF
jgi:hypothetical protein